MLITLLKTLALSPPATPLQAEPVLWMGLTHTGVSLAHWSVTVGGLFLFPPPVMSLADCTQ